MTWLRGHNGDLTIDELVAMPVIVSRLLRGYGQYLYRCESSLNSFRYTITAFQKAHLHLSHNLPDAWAFVDLWQALEPTTHRRALPVSPYAALVSFGLLQGWYKWVAGVIIGFRGITRVI